MADEIGLQLVAPDASWRERGDMHPQVTRGYRAAIVARARFIEDLVLEAAEHGVEQYVILGSGLDTFAQRRPDVSSADLTERYFAGRSDGLRPCTGESFLVARSK